MSTHKLTQICIGSHSHGYEPVTGRSINIGAFSEQEDMLKDTLLSTCAEHLWHKGSYSSGCPRPILVGSHHQAQMQDLHEAMTIAIADIVQRWWTDRGARLWERMPLKKEEEGLLKWVDRQVMLGNLPGFPERLGSWRPDFLVEDDDQQEENYRITEINARYSFNGFLHAAYGQKALNQCVEEKSPQLTGAMDPQILDGLFDLFDPRHPLHLLKGEENGIDIHMFRDAVKRRFGTAPRLITPNDLRIFSDPTSKSGYRLCCIVNCSDYTPRDAIFVTSKGETWEEIHQVGLELRQRELMGMEPELLRQVALRCFNDLRTVLLVHDKRMLGIIKQEIPHLKTRQVLTSAQAEALDRGIVTTILPNSLEMRELLEQSKASPDVRTGYILKAIRSGKGDGIVFGDDINQTEWISVLEKLSSADSPLEEACVVQRRIVPREYDLVLKASVGVVQYPLVGTYHVVNGKLLGLGTWRASGGRIVAVSSGGSWICSVVKQE
ncbi:hypothetical protein F66182_4466 [Fusarium sp. NRRL 66182]|nr:hypothetical protein F66182_4466 [Fusarium sp. NRRL 66182]